MKLIKYILKSITPKKKEKKKLESKPKTFLEYLFSFETEEFEYLKKNSLRINKIFETEADVYNLPYELIKIKTPAFFDTGRMDKLIIEVLNEAGKKISEKELNQYDYQHLLYFLFYITDTLKEISELEINQLQTTPDRDMVNAGIDRFNQFGILNTIDTLAKGDILKWELVKKLSYTDVFNKLLKNKVEGEFQKAYTKIITKAK